MCNILKTYIHTHFFVFDCLQLSRNFVVCLNFQVSFLSKNTQFSTQFGRCFTQIENCFNVKCLCDHQLPIPIYAPGTGLGINECGTTLDVVKHALELLVSTAVVLQNSVIQVMTTYSSILSLG